ncbi:MAG TPA: hypothetical protein VEC01_02585 [Noviherbaspirillum sp.]|uniref:hypothetical protein n=1 Tax=Noviherbaspirillum sp. TaxID=1926288 RepID=UPI002D5F4549|nr:hypothetical protein [Noviherbaspirillum sp.]HYD94187.1 hypothetical protein [Noviherbaspirillum sp.]
MPKLHHPGPGTRIALAVGALGFLLSFLVAALMLSQGNPGFLFIWMIALAATAACMRTHAKWRRSFERIYGSEPRTFYPAQRRWQRDVEDVVFRELPDGAASGC